MSFTDADGVVSWGWTVQDNYASLFDDTLEQEDLTLVGINLLRKVVLHNQEPSNDCEQLRDLLLSCWRDEKGMYIDGLFYDYEMVRLVLEELI
jgi:hypothetical protein